MREKERREKRIRETRLEMWGDSGGGSDARAQARRQSAVLGVQLGDARGH